MDRTCSFKYFELGNQRGPVFHGKNSVVSVGLLPSDLERKYYDHFCLNQQVLPEPAQESEELQRLLRYHR